MRPLRITATLSAPLAGDAPMLDALMEFAMSRHLGQSFGLSHANGPGRAEYQPGLIPVPIARRRVKGFPWPIALASSPIYSSRTDGVEHFARRFDVDPSLIREDGRRVYQTQSGEFKSYRLPLRLRLCDRVVWFAVGDRKEVRHKLKSIRAIGKKISIGYGTVKGWTVEDAADDYSWFAPSDAGTVLMRPLPTGPHLPHDLVGFRPWYGGIVPPYWAPEFYRECVVPC